MTHQMYTQENHMLADTKIEVYQGDMEAIVGGVFQTMLQMEAYPSNEPWRPSPGHFTSSVYFGGDWQGAVLVECARNTAASFTEKLMDIPLAKQTRDDMLDCMGELANMVGGNLKSVMPRGVGLSMPTVVEGSDYSVRVCGGNLTTRRSFRCEAGTFWVTLVEVVPAESRIH